MADNLFAVLGALRAEIPEISDEAWDRLKRCLADRAGGGNVYVPAPGQRTRLDMLADLSEAADAQTVSRLLGVSVRHARRLKRLL